MLVLETRLCYRLEPRLYSLDIHRIMPYTLYFTSLHTLDLRISLPEAIKPALADRSHIGGQRSRELESITADFFGYFYR